MGGGARGALKPRLQGSSLAADRDAAPYCRGAIAGELEQRLDLRFAAIDTRFEQVERQIDRMVTRLGALVVVVAGLLFGALHYFPPK